ncbi:MAG: hypothetical protein Q7R47_02205 [Candidatus Diapherotrites archaeon]|nr:hypothetical protein [Candidatus Diapherotrites archaeon]
MDDEYFPEDDQPQKKRNQFRMHTHPLFYVAIGLAIGFTLSMLVSPEFLEALAHPLKFDATISDANKWVSDDLRANLVILRVQDTNALNAQPYVATCDDGEACLGYKTGDSIKITCIGIQCHATKKA